MNIHIRKHGILVRCPECESTAIRALKLRIYTGIFECRRCGCEWEQDRPRRRVAPTVKRQADDGNEGAMAQ